MWARSLTVLSTWEKAKESKSCLEILVTLSASSFSLDNDRGDAGCVERCAFPDVWAPAEFVIFPSMFERCIGMWSVW